MARPLRIEFSGALYHVTSRGNERRPIFRSDRDRLAFLDFLGIATERFGWSVTAYVLMTNHFHLVIQTPEPNLSRGMHWLNGKYAGWYNHKHNRSGHLFQGRFKSFLIEKETYCSDVLRYVVLNPVAAKMVERPEDYRWSSYPATAGLCSAPDWLDLDSVHLSFGPDRETAQFEYRNFVLVKIGCEERLWDKLTNAIYLGSDEWTKKMRKLVESKPRYDAHPRTQRAVGRPKMHAIIQTISHQAKVPHQTIRSRAGGNLRLLAAWIGWNEGWITLRGIAAALRLRSEGHISSLIARCEELFGKNDVGLLAQLDAALTTLRA
ncbi:MAG TPA: transposase [Thermoanaerobaculia bacterium]